MIDIRHGDCIEVMRSMPDSSVDAIVTDPPYELGFMGKKWDSSGIAYNVDMWQEALRVLKPGGHLLAFGGTRTYHRMAVAIEDAGFEIRDCLQWLYGSGFPKSLDVSKTIDKAAGAEREVVGPGRWHSPGRTKAWGDGTKYNALQTDGTDGKVATAPATPEAQQWDGWGTALKPANEPIVLARKPLAEKTVAANVLEHGTGALNIDACRIGTSKDIPASASAQRTSGFAMGASTEGTSGTNPNIGRWPANVILDEDAAAMLDEQSGERGKSYGIERDTSRHGYEGGWNKRDGKVLGYGDTGGASRYFKVVEQDDLPINSGDVTRFRYQAKASRRERNLGLPDGMASNHPTVKPIALMRYLVRLVTPPGGIVLDPFAGSGTTGMACVQEGYDAILIEREAEYVEIARRRVAGVVAQRELEVA